MRSIGPFIAAAAFLAAPPSVARAAEGGGGVGGAPPGLTAGDARVLAPEYAFVTVAVSADHPGRYALVFAAERPTPGYRVDVESVRLEGKGDTIVARIVVIPPRGMVAQVITRTTFTVDLPALAPGPHAFRLEKRREQDSAFTPAVALTLSVAGPTP